ncbi:glycerophosphodiester phosphodiesterase family protein [Erythrobacter sp.]|jgi:glycerophosphoryl diester phosphodiesterase|uniref:glycerophosphodiester phosphodiesterase family protein n=1 Tax=Erythrobacter sp. TaxID=1042 RepID=UPI002EAF3F41|nr:glycerophosphodiester phosphodiesterase family protein [Erythrobacter sp.]
MTDTAPAPAQKADPASSRAPDWLTRWEFAHRGLHSPGVPENSLAAAKAAMAAGMGVECDVQRSLDRQAMVFHDWDLARLTDVTGLTEVFNAAELEAMVLQNTDERPSRLGTLLKIVGSDVPILVEIKSRPGYEVKATCELTAEVLEGYDGEYGVMSFDPRAVRWFARHSPAMVRGLVCTDTLDLGFLGVWRQEGMIEAADPHFLAVDIRDLPNTFARLWRESGRPLLAWTVRSPELRELALRETDALISEGEGLA